MIQLELLSSGDMFRRVLTIGNIKNGINVIENRGIHRGCTSSFMHERHQNVEENRKRIGIVGGSICAGQVCILKKNLWETIMLETLFFKLCISNNSCSEFYSKVHKGVKQAPDQIRKAGLIESLKELGKYFTYFESKRAFHLKHLLEKMKFILISIHLIRI